MHKLVIPLLILIPVVLFAQQKPLDAVSIQRIKNSVMQTAESTKTISSDFTQEKEMAILNDKIISSGKFYFKQENLLRWEYIHPFSYIITLCGNVINIRDDGQTREFNTRSNKLFAEINKIVVGSVRGTLLNDSENFKANYSQNQQYYIVNLIPQSEKFRESLQKILIYFDKTDFSVDQVELFESGADHTKITFTNKKINLPLPDEIFDLK
ncbi:MAG: outer membrane lipoprotein carrier protein LolA [bacterium]